MFLPWVCLIISSCFWTGCAFWQERCRNNIASFSAQPIWKLEILINPIISDMKPNHFFTVKTLCSTFVMKLVLWHIATVFRTSRHWNHLKCIWMTKEIRCTLCTRTYWVTKSTKLRMPVVMWMAPKTIRLSAKSQLQTAWLHAYNMYSLYIVLIFALFWLWLLWL